MLRLTNSYPSKARVLTFVLIEIIASEYLDTLAGLRAAADARLNESEAVIHAAYFATKDQWLFPNFGERRNAGEGLVDYRKRRDPSFVFRTDNLITF